ncbi:hypothetical protein FUAX_41190 (plasmid) [Fulvitalea axinellae]|uniref:DUF4132 domain-containing protein n=1 Tax=Fulvitalea axinellae TaxID=1182444 RepID=A0AAU9CXB9_9BACT|nr:hypothetical protein FUAX_41190 [Fulvitalea axinellae]
MNFLDQEKYRLSFNDDKLNLFKSSIINSLPPVHGGWKRYYERKDIWALPEYKNHIKSWPDSQKIEFLLYCVNIGRNDLNPVVSHHPTSTEKDRSVTTAISYAIFFLGEPSLASSANEDEVAKILGSIRHSRCWEPYIVSSWPISTFLNNIKPRYKDRLPSENTVKALNALADSIRKQYSYLDLNNQFRCLELIDEILSDEEHPEGVKPEYFMGEDSFALYSRKWLDGLASDKKRSDWFRLIALAKTAKGAQPKAKYLELAQPIVDSIGKEEFITGISEWVKHILGIKPELITLDIHRSGYTYQEQYYDFIIPPNIDILKGIIWTTALCNNAALAFDLGNLTERCYKKYPQIGALSAALGNACIFALSRFEVLEGVAQLARLSIRIKQASGKKTIEKFLGITAKEMGLTLDEIADLAVDDFGLVNGKSEFHFSDYRASLEFDGPGKSSIHWYKPDGSQQKTVPAFVKKDFADQLKKLKASKKQLDQTSATQRDRIDRMFRSDRKWAWVNFEKQYLEHGLISFFTKRLIWVFENTNISTRIGIYFGKKWIDAKGEVFAPSENDTVKLWHPSIASVEEVGAWRDFLVNNEIRQPVKQAYREVYILTDAEKDTGLYSNRMAAHILKQHQYVNLARVRGWKAELTGAWDYQASDFAEILLPEHGLKAQFWTSGVETDHGVTDSGILAYVSTDQVRFLKIDSDDTISLIDIPAVVFSEIMRDVDLFVGVASVGNDPEWQDSGVTPEVQSYWRSYLFGDLSEISQTRKDLLERLIPRLKINKVARVEGRFLVVKGKYRTYKIHIGSSNILMEPNEEYLCIVQSRGKKDITEKIFVPFEGDHGLSLVLSKAFLLAEDHKIKDPTILSQIRPQVQSEK